MRISVIFFFGFNFLLTAIQPAIAQTGKPVSVSRKGGIAIIETDKGKWEFSSFPGNIIKTSFRATNSTKNEQVSDAVILKSSGNVPVIKQLKNKVSISWNNQSVVEFSETGITYVINNKPKTTLNTAFCDSFQRGFNFNLNPRERIFGTGERSIPMNRRGYKVPLNNNPWYGYSLDADALNFSVPFVLSDELYALFFDNPSKGFLDIGKTNPEQLGYSVLSGELSFYFIPGNNFNQILGNYQRLVGTQPLPPRWAMGNLMSRFGYTSEAQTREIMGKMKRDSVPFDAVIFDLFWFGDSIKGTMGNLDWVNKNAWPDPVKMISYFSKQNIKTILITEPFVLKSSQNFSQSEKYHATDSNGHPYLLTDFYFGKGGLLDIFRKDAGSWFFSKYKKQIEAGVAGWWGDLGEPEKHPSDIFHNLSDLGFKRKFAADEVHNIYGHYWSRMLFENYRKSYPAKRLFHLNRSGYAGSPRYSGFPWSGDVSRSWNGLKSQLPLMLGMSVSGVPYIHSDAGGFAGGDGDEELYVRWLQFAAFTPIYRPHGTALGNLEPTVKDIPSEASLWPEPTRSLAKQAAQTRYRWLPYNYSLTYQQTKYGNPLVKPLFFLNPADSNLYNAGDQYLWGDQVMVVPVTDKGQRQKTYYIPDGNWTNLYNLNKALGPGWITDTTISMNNIPLWAKEGSFIPLAEPMLNTSEYFSKPLTIIHIPSSRPGRYELYEDDGETPDAIQKGLYSLIKFSSTQSTDELEIVISAASGNFKGKPAQRKFLLAIPTIGKAVAATIDGVPVSETYLYNESINGCILPVMYRNNKVKISIKLR